MRTVTTLFAAASLIVGLCGANAFAQASKPQALQLKDLPASVQKTIQETLKGGAIKKIAKEKEDGIEHRLFAAELEISPPTGIVDQDVATSFLCLGSD